MKLRKTTAKPNPSLFPWSIWDDITSAIEDGAGKYAPNDWQKNEAVHHWDKAMRHMIAWKNGEKRSADNDVHHMAAVAVNAMFALWLDKHQ